MNLNRIRIAAFASVASISLLSGLASAAPAADAMARGSENAAPAAKGDTPGAPTGQKMLPLAGVTRGDEPGNHPSAATSKAGAPSADGQKMLPLAGVTRAEAVKAGEPSADGQKMLPLAGVTQAQAISTWQKLASNNKLPFSDKDAEEAIRLLSNGSVNCDRLGLLCPLVGKERVPGIIRATWQAELRTADFNETMAAFDRAVSAAAQDNARDAIRTGDQVEAEFAKAVGDKTLDPDNERQVADFAAKHAHGGTAFGAWLEKYVTHSAGGKVVCDNKKWHHRLTYRMLAACGGDVWGELTTHLWGYNWTAGVVTVASVSTYFRSPLYCWPWSATSLTTGQTFKSSSQNNSNSSFIVSKTHVYLYTPPKNGTYSASSNESNVVALSLGPNALSF